MQNSSKVQKIKRHKATTKDSKQKQQLEIRKLRKDNRNLWVAKG